MKNLGSETLHHIQKMLTTRKKSPTKEQPKNISKSPAKRQKQTSRSPHKISHSLYQPMERDNAIIDRQLRTIYQQMENQNNYRVQNKHSYFLNAKNPKPPLYLRTQQIIKEKQMWIQQQLQLKESQKQAKEEEEYRQFLQMSATTKKISKNQALELTDRLYKEHYNKTSRMNEKKMERLKNQAQFYRNKPELSTTSKEIFKLAAEKYELQKDVVDRFKQYSDTKYQRQSAYENHYRNIYCPFKPNINEHSRAIASKHDQSKELSRSKHCNSCIALKKEKSSSSLMKSNGTNKMKRSLRADCRESTMIVSKFQ